MSEQWIDTKADLLTAISAGWGELHVLLDSLSAEEQITCRDDGGWNVRDHVTHLTAWERSLVYLLQHRPRYAGLGIAADLYASGDYDAMNDVIRQRAQHLSPAAALAELVAAHDQLLALLAPLNDDDLFKPVSAYTDSERGRRAEIAVIDVIDSNTAAHYAEHIGWMREWLPRCAKAE